MLNTHLLIATAGRANLLGRTLQSVADCRLPTSFTGVTVIENGPACGSQAICNRRYGDLSVRYMWCAVPNKSHALNVALSGMDESTFVIFSDDDIRFTPETLVAYEEAAKRRCVDRFYGGPFGCDYEVAPPTWMFPYMPLSAVGWNPTAAEFDPQVDRFLGFNWAAFCGDIVRLGGFDPNFGPGSPAGATGQESNMQRRMHAAGMSGELVPDAFVNHYVPRDRCSIDWTVERARRNGISRGLARRARPVTDIALSHWSNSVRLVTSTAAKWLTSPLPASKLHFTARYRQQKAIGYFTGFRTSSGEPSRHAA